MKISTICILSLLAKLQLGDSIGCPFSSSDHDVPCDETHGHLRSRRLASLSEDPDTREKLAAIIEEQKRLLQGTTGPDCIAQGTYDNLRETLGAMTDSIADAGERGHFIGGLVRLAAHDFMDFDQNAASLGQEIGGSDGCIDFDHAANAGLSRLWCDDPVACPFKALYDDVFGEVMSKADFWVASATAVIQNAAPSTIDIPFRWGRVDSVSCPTSSVRIPEPVDCGSNEAAFIDRMGLTWTDAVALLGAHTLGGGHAEFSGHPGTWVDDAEESTIFDKRYYTELMTRGWRPRFTPGVPDNDWTWGGNQRDVMMLNIDICLFFDIDNDVNCCTNINEQCNNNTLQNTPCRTNAVKHPEAHDAVHWFANGGRNNNDAFFEHFPIAWEKATENGHDSTLNELATDGSCEVIAEPSAAPSFLDIDCLTTDVYESLGVAMDDMVNAIANAGDRGHFIGGIVRLAAHDFMDFHQDADTLGQEFGGSDGCIDFDNPANAGLSRLWCDDPVACPFKALFDDLYSGAMSRADYWVAAATVVIQNVAPSPINIPFQWGRVDAVSCPNSSPRIPEPTGCDAVEDAFINRMGLTWTESVALLGAHTLGGGFAEFSGHPGTWVDSDAESTIFNKRYYTELLNRGWRPRFIAGVPDNDWTWGADDRGVMMLNVDICLNFDIDASVSCCTNTAQNCRNTFQNTECPDARNVRPEAHAAVQAFAAGNGQDNAAFFAAFPPVWAKATGNGYASLNNLVDNLANCPTPFAPSSVPSLSLAPSSSASPTQSSVTLENFQNLRNSLDTMVNSIANAGDRGHFIGGIVRLAAHDFMDFHQDADTLGQEFGGSDGCIDFDNPANAGLSRLWCDDPVACPFKALFDTVYSNIMSRADFWVASATAVIQNAATSPIDLPFRYGRVDAVSCPNSSPRIPEPTGCDAVEDAFINRMGLTWTESVALLGAHTLGGGFAEFSGHPGTWVDSDAESTIFNKRYYTELLNRGWRPRFIAGVPDNDWTWGADDRGVMMLNVDICLNFDIDASVSCCTNTAQNCRNTFQNTECPDARNVRPEAHAAVQAFAAGNGQDNAAFFAAFPPVWAKATGNGYASLNNLVDNLANCPTPFAPSSVPSLSLAPSSSASPTQSSVTLENFQNLRNSLDTMVNSIANAGDRGHFIGGIVRLAAHDFMDFHQDADTLGQEFGGSDGCIDFDNPANAGLSRLWCDDPVACPFKALFDDLYSGAMSRADYWVAAATVVIQNVAPSPINIPFQWGRVDAVSCPNSSPRIPEPTGCDAVEDAFINRMGLTWTESVALLGAHTLGGGFAEFSGHPGTWVDSDAESTIFNKRYYTELLNRGWRPRFIAGVPDNDWTWGADDRGVMMLNVDICLNFDIDASVSCCTNTAQNCRNTFQNTECPDASTVRPEAHAAVQAFAAGGGQDNAAFFAAFPPVWTKATENGHTNLNDLDTGGGGSDPPVGGPGGCVDVDSFLDPKGNLRDCAWVIANNKCDKFGVDECPVSCGNCSPS
eukprot:CAMPEP_0194227992 /NCGR_PEP_ID=MMETSP0156-20130528/43139_1 /TAXON_ID=33649 /ORGANISM="Thalassionema nitzschioides, Strain L26-B" /LENGTH=1501 /DNA_ID=CAMNT_0038960493 /DNA_START=21 /DNA_END=4526 /DNA_ORIENTATION=-